MSFAVRIVIGAAIGVLAGLLIIELLKYIGGKLV